MVSNIYPTELQLKKNELLNFDYVILDPYITIKNNSILTKIYDRRDDFDFGLQIRKILGHCNFSVVFSKIIKRFIKRGYDPTILIHTACLVFNPFRVGRYAFLLITSDGPSEKLHDGQFFKPFATELP
jgi:hypothetical protein